MASASSHASRNDGSSSRQAYSVNGDAARGRRRERCRFREEFSIVHTNALKEVIVLKQELAKRS
jgi:hypothetical protein